MQDFAIKKIKTTLAILMCMIIFLFGQFNYQIVDMTKLINSQSEEILEVSEKTIYWQDEINNLYEMNKSHANCVAMALLMNEEFSALRVVVDKASGTNTVCFGE